MAKIVDFDALDRAAANCVLPVSKGRVTAVSELVIEAQLPGARIGMLSVIERPNRSPVPARIAACRGSTVTLLPLVPVTDIGPGDRVVLQSKMPVIRCGRGLVGRIIDATGDPVDGGETLTDVVSWPIDRPAPAPLSRRPITDQLVTGVRSIDSCLALGRGQRIGLFAGPGLGKSTLLGTLAGRSACDLSVVCLVGERGREVTEFIHRVLGPEGLARSVVVLATADAPLIARVQALNTATAVAEWFRAEGADVLLLVDSLTRVVRAHRDLALAMGERPARGGFPAAAFSGLPALLERAGSAATGSITGIYAVLTEGGSDDPVAEEARALLDGHIVLSHKLAAAGKWPAIDILRSVSRVMDGVVPGDQRIASDRLRQLLAAYEENEDLIMMGAYYRGSSPDTDQAIDLKEAIDRFLFGNLDDPWTIEKTRVALAALFDGHS